MVRFLVVFLFGPLAAVELLFYGRFDLLLLGGSYFGLLWQADWAAERYVKSLKTAPPAPKEPTPEEIEVPPLSRPAEPRDEERVPLGPRLGASPSRQTNRPQAAKPAPPRPLPAQPRFHGAPHEVLGVREGAGTRTIGAAFRHWLKQFHPDQAPELSPALANARVQRLTEARNRLLARRRSPAA